MDFDGRNRKKWARRNFCVMVVLSALLLLTFSKVALAVESESVNHYKMISTVEYSGKTQFSSQVESLFTAKKQPLSDGSVRYSIAADNFDLLTGRKGASSGELSFVIDEKSRRILSVGKNMELLGKVNNQCIRFLQKVTKENIGKTWKQSFSLSAVGKPLPEEIKFTLTAIQVKAKMFGEEISELIAVRALSEPFITETAKAGGGTGSIRSRIGVIYLFDSAVENVYLSVSTFEANTNINGYKEKLRHEIATYKTDASGEAVALSKLGKKFEKLVQKLGLTKKALEIKKEAPLPQWARTDALVVAQAGNVCAATACEGALNPVIMVSMPAAQTVGLQSVSGLAGAGGATVGGALATSVPAVGGMTLAPGAIGAGTAAAIAGGTIAVAAGGSSGGSSSATSSSP